MAYLVQADLEDALGINTVTAIFDDDQDGVADARPIQACIDYATAECDAFLRTLAGVTATLTAVPADVKFAALDFAVAYAMRRRPDVARAMGEASWAAYYKAAIEKMERFASEAQRFSGLVGPAQVAAALPDTAPPPEGLGASLVDFGAPSDCGPELVWWRKEGCG